MEIKTCGEINRQREGEKEGWGMERWIGCEMDDKIKIRGETNRDKDRETDRWRGKKRGTER
jgi:hypothetical protein